MTQEQALRYRRRRIREQREAERRRETLKAVLAVLALILCFALFVAIGGDDMESIIAHEEYMQELKDSGAWVMW